GREAFERIVGTLESIDAAGSLHEGDGATEATFAAIAQRARKGTIIVLLSDLLDLPESAFDRFVALAPGRTLAAVQILDPDEASFPFEGMLRLKSMEGETVVETDASAARARYLEALAALTEQHREK